MKDVKDKNIIVTGASGGIGNSIIKKLSEAGANILASERWIQNNNPSGIVFTILCDRGERYCSILDSE